MPPSKVCPQCETKAESVLLVSAVQGFCYFCSLPYTFRYVFVNACASSSCTCKNSLAHPRPNISVEGLHFSAFLFTIGKTTSLEMKEVELQRDGHKR